MPAESEEQRRLFGMALSIKRGRTPRSASAAAAKLADENSEETLRDFARKRKSITVK